MEILVKNVMKTADANKLFSEIFERTYYGLYIITFCGCSMSLSKVMTRGVILHSSPKKRALKSPTKNGVLKAPIRQVYLQA